VISSVSAWPGRSLARSACSTSAREAVVAQLHGREVDVEHERGGELAPRGELAAGLAQDPAPDRADDADLLGHGDEGQRRDHAARRVCPARERLDPDRAPALELDHGLVHEAQLVALERVAQIGLELDARQQRGAHRGLVRRGAVAARLLGAVHREVGVAQQLVGARRGVARVGDADRGPDEDLLALHVEGPAHGGDDALGDGVGLDAAPVVLEQHRELVAPEARRGVGCARAGGEPLGHGAQELVAGGVADAVVDGLEAIQVDEQHAQLGRTAGRHVQRVLQAVQEERAVGQPGEGVAKGLLHGLDGARVGQREARVLGEGVEHAELGVVEAAGRHGHERARAGAVDVDRGGQRPVGARRGRGARRGGGHDGQLGLRALAAGGGGGHDRALGIERIVEDERHGAAAEQAAGPRGDRAEHVGQRLAVRDRALDVEQDLEQAVALAQHLLGAHGGDAAQRELEDARHPGQRHALVGAERRAATRDDEAGPALGVPLGARHPTGADTGEVDLVIVRVNEPDRSEAARGHQCVADDHGAHLGAELLGRQLGGGRGRALGALMRAHGGQELDELMRRGLRHQAIAHDVMPV